MAANSETGRADDNASSFRCLYAGPQARVRALPAMPAGHRLGQPRVKATGEHVRVCDECESQPRHNLPSVSKPMTSGIASDGALTAMCLRQSRLRNRWRLKESQRVCDTSDK